jgi:hypothetical protein
MVISFLELFKITHLQKTAKSSRTHQKSVCTAAFPFSKPVFFILAAFVPAAFVFSSPAFSFVVLVPVSSPAVTVSYCQSCRKRSEDTARTIPPRHREYAKTSYFQIRRTPD